MAKVHLRILSGEGAKHETFGEASERKAFALYMVDLLGDCLDKTEAANPEGAEFRVSLATFLEAANKFRLRSQPIVVVSP